MENKNEEIEVLDKNKNEKYKRLMIIDYIFYIIFSISIYIDVVAYTSGYYEFIECEEQSKIYSF